jgi:hypothetical protein
MREAKTLGIPLRLPAANGSNCRGNLTTTDGQRAKTSSTIARSSVARLIDEAGHVAVTLANPAHSMSPCSRCSYNELAHCSDNNCSSPSGHRVAQTKSSQQQTRTSSPLRDRFRLCNLFGRKSSNKDDESATATTASGKTCAVAGSTSKNATESHHNGVECYQQYHHHHRHHHQHQHRHHHCDDENNQLLLTQTLPARSTARRGDRPATATILMTSSTVGSPGIVRRRPATIAAQTHSQRSASTSRALSAEHQRSSDSATLGRKQCHRDATAAGRCAPPSGDDDFDEVDGVTCRCTNQSLTKQSTSTTGKLSDVACRKYNSGHTSFYLCNIFILFTS